MTYRRRFWVLVVKEKNPSTLQTRSHVPEVCPNSQRNNDILLWIPTFLGKRGEKKSSDFNPQSHGILESNYISKDKAERETRFTTQKHFIK